MRTHIVLSEVDEVLQVDVISVRLDIIVDEKVELVFDPVLKDEGEDARSQLQEEDQTQEHRKLESAGQAKEETQEISKGCHFSDGKLMNSRLREHFHSISMRHHEEG